MRYALSASLFVVCIGASGGSAAVQDAAAGPGAKAIMERVETAKGTLPANERITETYEESGLKGKRILYRLNKDWREVTIGPDFLKYFTVSMDYGDSTFYLVPNDLGRRYIHATVAKPKSAPLTTATPAAAPTK